jgi:primosomal replication protein N
MLLQPAKDETDEERMVRLEMEALAAEEKARNQAVSNGSSLWLAGCLAVSAYGRHTKYCCCWPARCSAQGFKGPSASQ